MNVAGENVDIRRSKNKVRRVDTSILKNHRTNIIMNLTKNDIKNWKQQNHYSSYDNLVKNKLNLYYVKR